MRRMNRIPPALAAASLALLAGAWAWREPQAASPAGANVRPAPEEEQSPLPTAPRSEPEEAFWSGPEPADRELVLRRAEDLLGLNPEEARAFRSAALAAVEDVDRAWRVREEGWIAVSSSAASDLDLLSRLEDEIQFRYESEKGRALQRVAAHLGGSELLRDRLEEWFDALR